MFGNRVEILVTIGNEREKMNKKEERIKAIYNDCWAIYKQYLADHDMGKYNLHKDELYEKYNGEPDIEGLLFWWAARVQGLHDEYMRSIRQ